MSELDGGDGDDRAPPSASLRGRGGDVKQTMEAEVEKAFGIVLEEQAKRGG